MAFPFPNRSNLLTIYAVINYFENIDQRRVLPDVQPGYLRKLIPSTPPEDGERWETIQKDIEDKIMSGLTHWFVPDPPLRGICSSNAN